MTKKSVSLDGLVQPESRSSEIGILQRGAAAAAAAAGSRRRNAAQGRKNEKRLTLAIDGDTYRRLRMHAAQTDQTHRAILDAALAEFLNRANA